MDGPVSSERSLIIGANVYSFLSLFLSLSPSLSIYKSFLFLWFSCECWRNSSAWGEGGACSSRLDTCHTFLIHSIQAKLCWSLMNEFAAAPLNCVLSFLWYDFACSDDTACVCVCVRVCVRVHYATRLVSEPVHQCVFATAWMTCLSTWRACAWSGPFSTTFILGWCSFKSANAWASSDYSGAHSWSLGDETQQHI